MNKQELIKKYKELENGTFDIAAVVVCQSLLKDLEQLDEPQKVVVPQFVADWYEENKDDFETNLFQCIYEIFGKHNDSELNEFENWVIDENIKPFQTLVNMHQFGYEVEEEKRYIVRLKNIREDRETLNCEKRLKIWNFSSEEETTLFRTKHTRKELEEAGFGWVFDCEGIEIKEVE